MNPFDFDGPDAASADSPELPPPEEPAVPTARSTPPEDARSFTPPYARILWCYITAVMGYVTYQGIEAARVHGGWAGITVPFTGAFFVVGLIQIVRPLSLIVWPGAIQSVGIVRFESAAANVEALYHDGRFACLRFRDADRVLAAKATLDRYRKLSARGKDHFRLQLTAEQVAEMRSLSGIPEPAEDSPEGRIEAFHSDLRAAVPVPWATYFLIAALVIAFAALALAGLSPTAPTPLQLIDAGANFGPLTTNGESWRLGTSLFVHIGFLHLLASAFTLQYLGSRVERLYGPARYLMVFAFGGLAGSLLGLYLHPDAVGAGATACIFGVMGAIFAHLLACRNSLAKEVYQRELRSGITFLIANLLLGLALPGVEADSNFGGFFFGFLFALLAGSRPSADSPAGWGRPLLALGVGVAGLALAFGEIPKVPLGFAEFLRALEKFPKEEGRILRQGEEIDAELQKPNFNRRKLADRIEADVLGPWKAIEDGFGGFKFVPEIAQNMAPLLDSYIKTRGKVWESEIEALRDGDDLALQDARKASAAVGELRARLDLENLK